MPELPEVEIIKQSLQKRVLYKKIKNVLIKNRNLRFKIEKNFENLLKDRVIINISRFSKYIILTLNNYSYLLIHLGMSGTLHLVSNKKKNKITNMSFYRSKILPQKHNHIIIKFEEFIIVYNDPRRFGFFKILSNKNELINYFKNLGPEAISPNFNLKYIKRKFLNKKKNIKNFLLDQKFVSGIGNIYANEILFNSKIKPFRKAKSLTKDDCKKILLYSKLVLKKAIRKGGSSIRDFQNTNGTIGNFQKEFNVYQRENLNCLKAKCKGIIKKKIISNRSSFFCNYCQK